MKEKCDARAADLVKSRKTTEAVSFKSTTRFALLRYSSAPLKKMQIFYDKSIYNTK